MLFLFIISFIHPLINTCHALANNKPCSSDSAANKLASSEQPQSDSKGAGTMDSSKTQTSDKLTNSADVGDVKETVPGVETDVEMKTAGTADTAPELPSDCIDFKIVYNKQNFNVNFSLSATILSLKQHIETLTGVPHTMQKLLYKGKRLFHTYRHSSWHSVFGIQASQMKPKR